MFENVNEIAVLVTAVLAVAVGSIWYSPLMFGSIWMRSLGIRPGDEVMSSKEMKGAILKGVINQIIFFLAIAFLVASLNTAINPWELAVWLIVLLGTQAYGPVLWEQKKVSYFLVNIGYTAFILFAGLGVIMYWPW